MTRFSAPEPGAHGGDGARLAAILGVPPEEVLDLSASLNPCAPDVSPLSRPCRGRRPLSRPRAATAALADTLGVDEDRLVLTNGGAEAIALVAAELPVGDVDPSDFSLYAASPRAHRVRRASDGVPTRTTRRACSPASTSAPPSGTRRSIPSQPARGPAATRTPSWSAR